MIGLDTNVLVRYLVEDDEAQYRRTTKLIEATVARGEELFISDIVESHYSETTEIMIRGIPPPSS